ncbi:MAG: hypothetical protein AMXMBFR53_13450 [Gemmatimonadota bacterium]
MEKSESVSVLLMVVLLAFAVVIVDERVLRTSIAVLPALMLAQKALGVGRPPAEPAPLPAGEDRRKDEEVRSHIEQLLKHFREFYTTCHLMNNNVLTIEAAEERVNNLERDLNRLLAKVTETARSAGVGAKG